MKEVKATYTLTIKATEEYTAYELKSVLCDIIKDVNDMRSVRDVGETMGSNGHYNWTFERGV